MMRNKLALMTATALGALALAGVAVAQQTPPAASPAPQTQHGAPAAPGPGAGSGMMGQGMMGQGMMGQGMREGMGERRGWRGEGRGERGHMNAMSEQDRTAFFAARLAAMKAGLMLTPDQEKLWPAVENAVRDAQKQRQAWRERIQKEGQLANPVDALRRASEMTTQRGETMKRIADAAGPLYNTLTDEQKRRMRVLGGHMFGGSGMGMGGMGMGGAGSRMAMGDGRHHEGRHEGRGYEGRGHYRDHHRDHHSRDERGRGGGHGGYGGYGRMSDDGRFGGFDRGSGLSDWRNL
jgi:zinc resistance-associated protein